MSTAAAVVASTRARPTGSSSTSFFPGQGDFNLGVSYRAPFRHNGSAGIPGRRLSMLLTHNYRRSGWGRRLSFRAAKFSRRSDLARRIQTSWLGKALAPNTGHGSLLNGLWTATRVKVGHESSAFGAWVGDYSRVKLIWLQILSPIIPHLRGFSTPLHSGSDR